MNADEILTETTLLRTRITELNNRHDDLAWDAFSERMSIKAEVSDLEARVAHLRREAALSQP